MEFRHCRTTSARIFSELSLPVGLEVEYQAMAERRHDSRRIPRRQIGPPDTSAPRLGREYQLCRPRGSNVEHEAAREVHAGAVPSRLRGRHDERTA